MNLLIFCMFTFKSLLELILLDLGFAFLCFQHTLNVPYLQFFTLLLDCLDDYAWPELFGRGLFFLLQTIFFPLHFLFKFVHEGRQVISIMALQVCFSILGIVPLTALRVLWQCWWGWDSWRLLLSWSRGIWWNRGLSNFGQVCPDVSDIVSSWTWLFVRETAFKVLPWLGLHAASFAFVDASSVLLDCEVFIYLDSTDSTLNIRCILVILGCFLMI